MGEKLKLSYPIIVEGKYDKIKLGGIVDATIITTDGFGIFCDQRKRQLIANLGKRSKLIILTDSDNAGFRIRRFIHSFMPKESLIDCYIPDIYGKEKRKEKPSKEGKLGAEGVPDSVLLESIKASLRGDSDFPIDEGKRKITKLDFFELGLTGGEGSSQLRQRVISYFDLPEHITTNSLIDILNRISDYDELILALEERD